MKKHYELTIAYAGSHHSVEFDREIRKAIGRLDDSSGLGMGMRDLSWTYKIKTSSVAGFLRLKTFFGKKGFRFANNAAGVAGKRALLELFEVETETHASKRIRLA